MDNACLCIQCGKHFKTVRTLTQHQKIHSGLRPHVCEVCNKSFVRKDTLQEHVKAHDPSKSNYVCQECGKVFGRRFSLQAHVMHHTPENRFACTMCGKKYLTKSNLERHKETHNPKEKCPKCNVDVMHLKLHLKTCGATASYPCTSCGKKFGQKRYLVQHQLIHLPIKQYECTKCHKSFKHRGSLLYHKKRCASTLHVSD